MIFFLRENMATIFVCSDYWSRIVLEKVIGPENICSGLKVIFLAQADYGTVNFYNKCSN